MLPSLKAERQSNLPQATFQPQKWRHPEGTPEGSCLIHHPTCLLLRGKKDSLGNKVAIIHYLGECDDDGKW